MRKRYLVLPGYVMSQRDGQQHWIHARRLMELYQVRPADCIVAHARPTGEWWLPAGVDGRGLIVLAPRHDGNYSLSNPNDRANYLCQ